MARFLAKNGQALLPMVELIEQSKMALDEWIDGLGRAHIEAVLRSWWTLVSVRAYRPNNEVAKSVWR